MEIIFLRQPHKFIRGADNLLKSKLREEVLLIKEFPKMGKLLKGKLKTLRVHKFVFNKTNYRIAYMLEGNILVVYIASRENFYKDLVRNI